MLGLLIAAGCGKNEAVVAAVALADAVCACPDKACAAEAHKKGLEQVMKHMGSSGTRADSDAIKAAGDRLQGCLDALQQRHRP